LFRIGANALGPTGDIRSGLVDRRHGYQHRAVAGNGSVVHADGQKGPEAVSLRLI
jgi:hypothetical protein